MQCTLIYSETVSWAPVLFVADATRISPHWHAARHNFEQNRTERPDRPAHNRQPFPRALRAVVVSSGECGVDSAACAVGYSRRSPSCDHGPGDVGTKRLHRCGMLLVDNPLLPNHRSRDSAHMVCISSWVNARMSLLKTRGHNDNCATGFAEGTSQSWHCMTLRKGGKKQAGRKTPVSAPASARSRRDRPRPRARRHVRPETAGETRRVAARRAAARMSPLVFGRPAGARLGVAGTRPQG